MSESIRYVLMILIIRREKAIDKIRSHKQLHNQDKILLRSVQLKWSMNNIGK
jgi:hypothetical protein